MMTLFLILGGSFALSLIFTPAARALALRYGLVDSPDRRRKTHARPIPVAGGIAIFLSAVATLAAVLPALPVPIPDPAGHGMNLLGLLAAAAVICAVGVVDDYGCLRGRHKLLGQLAAVLIAIQFGLVVQTVRVFDWRLDLGPL